MQATLQAVQPYELHGVLYYALLYVADGDPQPHETRVSHDMAYADPAPGDRIEVHAILGIVDRVTRLPDASG